MRYSWKAVSVVDEARVRRLLLTVGGNLALLKQRAQLDRHSLMADVDRLAAVKYFFVLAIEGSVDVAHHLAASESWEAPATNAAAFAVLARHRVLDPELSRRLSLAAGFRNVLVHDYTDVDDTVVLDNLDHLDDLDNFVDAVTDWMERQASG